MIRYGNQQEVEEYFSVEAASQSYLKSLLGGVEFINRTEQELYYEEKGHFLIGSGVDIYLTQGLQEFNNQYHIFSSNKPSDTIMSIVNKVYDDYNFDDMEAPRLMDLSDLILESCNLHSYSTNWKDETRVNKIIEGGSDYFQELIESSGKQILGDIENQIISNITMSLKTHSFTEKYFKDDGFDIFYQVPIYFTQNGIKCKVLIDMILVNHKKKVIQPIDIKTIGDSTKNFPKALRRRRYDIQASFYTNGLYWLTHNKNEAMCPIEEFKIQGYSIAPFKFLVESTDYKVNKITGEVNYYQGNPLVFTVSKETMQIGKYGRPKLYVDGLDTKEDPYKEASIYQIEFPEIKGWWQALELYQWHQTFGTEFDKEIFENNGDLTI